MKQPTTLKKPTLDKGKTEAALAFAEGNKPTKTTEQGQGRVFHAPAGFRRLTINAPIELHKKLKLEAIHRDCTATDIILELLERELGKRGA